MKSIALFVKKLFSNFVRNATLDYAGPCECPVCHDISDGITSFCPECGCDEIYPI